MSSDGGIPSESRLLGKRHGAESRPVVEGPVGPKRANESQPCDSPRRGQYVRRHADVYGTSWCSDCKRAKQLLGEQRVPYAFVDIDADAEGLAYVQEVNEGKSVIPVILFEDGSTLVEPSNAELAAKLGITTEARVRRSTTSSSWAAARPGSPPRCTPPARASRPSSSSAAGVGGQAGVTERLDNFPGLPRGRQRMPISRPAAPARRSASASRCCPARRSSSHPGRRRLPARAHRRPGRRSAASPCCSR